VNLLSQVVVVARYLGLYFWPAGLSLDHEARVVTSLAEPLFLAALALLLGLSVLALRAPRRRPLAAAGWLWFAFALAPTSSILPLNVLMNEHRLYLPSFGLFLWAAHALAPILARVLASARGGSAPARVALACGALCCVGLGARTIVRKLDFHTAERQWASAVAVSPGSPIARLGYGNELALRGDMRGACAQFEAVVAIDPRHDAGRINLAECLLRRQEEEGDRASLERAVELLDELVVQREDSTLVALKAARAYQLRYLAGGNEADREHSDAHLRAVLRRDPLHPGAREAEKRFARERAEARGTAEAR
jgi:tetratricopeptide (TPR) repeat protein